MWGLGKLLMSDSDGLFPAAELEHVGPVVDDGVAAGAGVNKRFRAFEPAAVMLVPRRWMSGFRRIISPVSSLTSSKLSYV